MISFIMYNRNITQNSSQILPGILEKAIVTVTRVEPRNFPLTRDEIYRGILRRASFRTTPIEIHTVRIYGLPFVRARTGALVFIFSTAF